MIAFRRNSVALAEGAFVALDAPEPVLAFERRTDEARALCLFNLGPDPVLRPASGTLQLAVGEVIEQPGSVSLGGYSAAFIAI
jgi:alpha-glucosidase